MTIRLNEALCIVVEGWLCIVVVVCSPCCCFVLFVVAHSQLLVFPCVFSSKKKKRLNDTFDFFKQNESGSNHLFST